MEVMRIGNRNRHQAETKMNRHSSRSHAVFIVTVTNRVDPSKQRFAQLYLVDLAGSERVLKTAVQGQQLEEAKNINKSLLALGQVIWALAHKQKHVPRLQVDAAAAELPRWKRSHCGRWAVRRWVNGHGHGFHARGQRGRIPQRPSLRRARVAGAELGKAKRRGERAMAMAPWEDVAPDLAQLRACCRRLQAELTASRCQLGEAGAADHGRKWLVVGTCGDAVGPSSAKRDPVLAADGWTYERRALEKYMARPGVHGLPKSPATQLQRLASPGLGDAGGGSGDGWVDGVSYGGST
eukprot:Skav208638  [mRNA]  locus=scaffold1081:32822:47201:- [translate_table: standard]